MLLAAAMAVSAANSIISAGYGNADKVYLTGQAWDDDVKQFQVTKYGMKDFNHVLFAVHLPNLLYNPNPNLNGLCCGSSA